MRISLAIALVLLFVFLMVAGIKIVRFGAKAINNRNDTIQQLINEGHSGTESDSQKGPSIDSGQGLEEVSCLPDRQARGRSIRMKVTAYCLCKVCCGKWAAQKIRRTATGDDAKIYDGVAADPKFLSYRIRLNIPGIGVKEVDDTGGGMRQSAKQGIYHIDVRMPSHQEARKWGVRWLDVEVLGS